MINFDLTKTPLHKFFFSTGIILSLIIPGFSYIFLQKYNLFLDLEISKLILLSIFYSLPVLFINITAEYFLIIKEIENDIELATFGAATGSLLLVYSSIVVYQIFPSSNFLILLYFMNFLNNFIMIIFKFYRKRKKLFGARS